MSRSYKKPILKDSPCIGKRSYHRVIRRAAKQLVKQDKDVPHRNSMINQYDYCDWIFRVYVEKSFDFITPDDEQKARRK